MRLARKYKKTNCYVSEESVSNEALIKGLYIVKEDIIGVLPNNIWIKLCVCDDSSINTQALEDLFFFEYNKYGTSCKILNNKYIIIHGMFYSPTICKRKGIYSHLRFSSDIHNFKNIVNNIIIHRKYLQEIPNKIFFELKWEYNEILHKNSYYMNSLFLDYSPGWNHKMIYD